MQINTTMLTLFPKIEKFENDSQFRPISCCNSLYKCISKLCCRRLEKVLPIQISSTQAFFVHDRYLIQNVLIFSDILRHYRRKNSARCLMTWYDGILWRKCFMVMYSPKVYAVSHGVYDHYYIHSKG